MGGGAILCARESWLAFLRKSSAALGVIRAVEAPRCEGGNFCFIDMAGPRGNQVDGALGMTDGEGGSVSDLGGECAGFGFGVRCKTIDETGA